MNKGNVSTLPSEKTSPKTELVPDLERVRAEERARAEEIFGLYQHTPNFMGVTVQDVLEVLRKRWLYILIGLAAGVELAFLTLAMMTPLYAVSAQVVITRQDPGELVDTDSGSSAFIATQAEVMQSPEVVQAAVALLPRPAFLGPDADPAAVAMDSVHASAISGTRVVALGYLGADAHYGASLLSKMVEVYRDRVRSTTSSGQASMVDTRHAELAALTEEIAETEARITSIRESNAIVGTADEAVSAQREVLDDQVEELTDARNRRIELESQLASGQAPSIANDPVRRALEEKLRQAESELAIATVMLTPEHPDYIGAKRNVDVLRKQYAASMGGSRVDLRQEISALERQERELTTIVTDSHKRLEEFESHRREENMVLVELARMQAQADEWRRELFNQRLVSRLAEAGDVGVGARIIEEPLVPDNPVWPKEKLIMAVGGMVGLLLGFALGLFSLHRQRKREVVEW